MKLTTGGGMFALIVVAGIIYALYQNEVISFGDTAKEGIACTLEAKQCPDGSYVGRAPPSCEFAACPDMTGKKMAALTGRVTLSPTCPVERVPADPSCAARAYQTVIEVRRLGGAPALATTTSDQSGYFSIIVTPGSYEVGAVGKNPFPRCSPQTVTLTPASLTTLDLDCDTGIR